MDGYTPSSYGDGFADVYDHWYSSITDVDATTAVVRELATAAGSGPVVELGVGTGRIALPLLDAGFAVVGIDASAAMLDVMRAKPGAERAVLVEADLGDAAAMAAVDVADVSVVLLTYNTLFNLVTDDAQRTCLSAAAGWLAPGGSVVVETFVPADGLEAGDRRLEPLRVAADEVVLAVSEIGDDGRTVSGNHVHLTEAGIRMRPWRIRMLAPAELDELAGECGLVVRERWADWDRTPFDADSDRHVTVFGRPDERR